MHQILEQNKHGRDFIMGDLHGCYDLFIQELENIGFVPENDRLISVGDIIDRGPDSAKCLELLDLPWFHMVLGNHEQMMIEAILLGQGTGWAADYGDWTANMDAAEEQGWARRLSELPTAITLDGGGFQAGICHAEPPGSSWTNVETPGAEAQMLWGRKVLRNRPKEKVKGIDFTLHGHTPLEIPAWVGNRYFLDTGAWYTDILTIRNIGDIWDEYQGPSRLFHAK